MKPLRTIPNGSYDVHPHVLRELPELIHVWKYVAHHRGQRLAISMRHSEV